MSSIKQNRGAPVAAVEVILLWLALGLIAGVVGTGAAALHVASVVDGTVRPAVNPFEAFFDAARAQPGGAVWSTTATAAAVVLGTLYLTVVGFAIRVYRRTSRTTARVDKAARHMGTGKNVAPLTAKVAGEKAARLSVSGAPGLVIGSAVAGGQLLYQDWESCSVDIAGTRTGKTTGRVIPAVMAAPGAVVTTSNKRDVVDATRGPRESMGRVWVFDPQGLVDEPVTWWWNPLTYVTDEARAAILASVFSAATTKAGAKTDAYFDTASLNLLANFLLAAAVAQLPITQVYEWLANSNDDQPAALLERAGYRMQAVAVRGVVSLNEKQRGGIYGGAIEKVAFLASPKGTAWVTPPAYGRGVEFKPDDFARSSDSLYSLSKEGAGSAGPLVTALTVAVCEAAEDYAKLCPGGRLPVPLVAVLDEAANVCRWPELPNLYSHYGSRGVNVLTFLQSWAQGVEVWGQDGMKKLWSAANVNVYGGGVTEIGFLEDMAKIIGSFVHVETSVSYRGMGSERGHNYQHRDVQIMDPADLAALDPGRLVVFASGAVPTLAKQERWYTGPHRAAIEASIAQHTALAASSDRAAATGPVVTPVTHAEPAGKVRNPWLS